MGNLHAISVFNAVTVVNSFRPMLDLSKLANRVTAYGQAHRANQYIVALPRVFNESKSREILQL
jgi:hypothetical protein